MMKKPSRNIAIVLLISLLIFTFSGCDLASEFIYLSEATQQEVIDYLALHENTIKSNYQAWNGTVIDFLFELEYPCDLDRYGATSFFIILDGKFLIDFDNKDA